eukprot:scaffold126124_cov37-Tisochrysis_lutea.AAC.2
MLAISNFCKRPRESDGCSVSKPSVAWCMYVMHASIVCTLTSTPSLNGLWHLRVEHALGVGTAAALVAPTEMEYTVESFDVWRAPP